MYTATRINRFSRRNGASGYTSRDPMTLDAIRAVAPSIFAEDKHSSRSDRYTYIPTSQIVEHLMSKDYGVFAVSQGGSRDEDKRGFTKHLVRFRPLSQTTQVGGTHNEIVLLNSHDGTSAYRLMAGVFRLVCSNGLIVSEGVLDDIRIQHSGRILENVAEGVQRMTGQLPLLSSHIEAMKETHLEPIEQKAFARAALLLKYDEQEAPVSPEQVLQPRRLEDKASDLWTTFNAVQESLVRGGHRYVKRTDRGIQRRTTNAVNSVSGNTSLNRALWALAEEMKNIKAR